MIIVLIKWNCQILWYTNFVIDFRDNNSWLFLLGLAAIVLELFFGVSTGFDLVVIGSIFVLAGGVGMLSGSFLYALITIIFLSFFYIVLGRKFIKNKLSIATTNTNGDALIGKKAQVIKEIQTDSPGQVKIEGEIWRANADETIAEGTEIVIESISGVSLQVKKTQ